MRTGSNISFFLSISISSFILGMSNLFKNNWFFLVIQPTSNLHGSLHHPPLVFHLTSHLHLVPGFSMCLQGHLKNEKIRIQNHTTVITAFKRNPVAVHVNTLYIMFVSGQKYDFCLTSILPQRFQLSSPSS